MTIWSRKFQSAISPTIFMEPIQTLLGLQFKQNVKAPGPRVCLVVWLVVAW